MATQVSNPLTLVMNIKSPADAAAIAKMLAEVAAKPEGENPINKALTEIGTVHFARFVFLSPLELAVITTYDGDFAAYVKAFTVYIGDIFDALLSHMADAPTLPVKDNLAEFLKYVEDNDRSRVGGVLQSEFSAYPELTVFDILNLARQ